MAVERILKILVLAAVFSLAGCAYQSTPVVVPDTSALWRDAAYGYPASSGELIPAAQVFALDAPVVQELQNFTASTADPGRRFQRLLDDLFGQDMQDFPYIANRTTPAAETWRSRGGNCISLAIMTLTLTEQLGLKARIQEVKIPGVWERRGELNLLYRHINVQVHRPSRAIGGVLGESTDVVIDFDPSLQASQRDAVPLTRQRVLAMFYSNRAVEAMIRNEQALAYANFHAAAEQDPSFESIWINLAHLYQSQGDPAAAEPSLQLALQLSPDSYAALIGMQQALTQMGRADEAAAYEQKLAARRKRDPYYLYQQGLAALEQGDSRAAQRHFEQAAKRITGYKELHEQLYRLYLRAGDVVAADEQQRQLTLIQSRDRSTVIYGPELESKPEP